MRKRLISEKYSKFNYSIPTNSIKNPIEFLRMNTKKNTERI